VRFERDGSDFEVYERSTPAPPRGWDSVVYTDGMHGRLADGAGSAAGRISSTVLWEAGRRSIYCVGTARFSATKRD